jgi:hypothetical protein
MPLKYQIEYDDTGYDSNADGSTATSGVWVSGIIGSGILPSGYLVLVHREQMWVQDLNTPTISGLYTETTWDIALHAEYTARVVEYNTLIASALRVSGYIADLASRGYFYVPA